MSLDAYGIDWVQIVKQALEEDLRDGDVTTECTIDPEQKLSGKLIAKQEGIIAGLQVFQKVFLLLDSGIEFQFNFKDGEPVKKGDVVAVVQGFARPILSGERVALNFLQRMSGIATLTRKMVEAVKGTKARILDTRKTAPGLRVFDKWAVTLGGGQNHRFGLFDMVLIKDNHIAACGSIRRAVERVRECDNKKRPIEVEVKNLEELKEALSLKVDRILLDNMDLTTMFQAVKIANGQIPLEASGNVTLESVAEIAATGVDFISIGSLTHSVKALDLSFLI